VVAVSASPFSPHWYRVSHLRPRLRAQVQVQRQKHRDQVWHQIADASSGRRHRLNQAAWRFVGCFDGQLTVGEVWDAVVQSHGDQALTQDEAIRVLEQLSSAELLQCDLPPDIEALFRQKEKHVRRQRWMALNPFSLRVRLFDPTGFLSRFDPILPRLFSRAAFALWLMLIVPALPMAVRYWAELKAFGLLHADSPRYLLIAWLVYPLIKALHEAGHALAVRRWGGEVHNAGFTVFVLMPVPYVDASAASGFVQRSRRAVVSAIGIMIELLIASLALYVWANVQPGLVRDTAFVAMLIAGLSSLVVNGNPLVRFDGYFLFCDLIDVPNLDQRSRNWWVSFFQRRLFGADVPVVPLAAGERKWMVLYAPLAWGYRLYLGLQMMLWAAAKSALLGLLFAAAFVGLMLMGPLRVMARFARQLRHSSDRPRTRLAVAGIAAALFLAAVVLPLPFGTTAQAVVWLPEQAQVRAGTEGFVQQIRVRDGEPVSTGQVLAVLDDPDLLVGLAEANSRLTALRTEQYNALRNSRSQALSLEQAIAHAAAEVARLEERVGQLIIRSDVAGRMVLMRQDDLPGSFLKKGTLLGYVMAPGAPTVRAIVPHADAALVRERTRSVSVRLEDNANISVPAVLQRDVPAATLKLPSAALADRNGGAVLTDPSDKEHLRALEPFFMFDVELTGAQSQRIGGRAWTYFDFGPEPLVFQWAHSMRQLMIQHFGGGT
jgi:putative peptide zinc metalloprotease protein